MWSRLLQMKTEDVTVDARCVAVNRGGALVKVHGLDGFCPASQLPMVSAGGLESQAAPAWPLQMHWPGML